MPASDYSSAVGGGLKLKGAPKGAGIDKKRKKKKPKPAEDKPSGTASGEAASEETALQKVARDSNDEGASAFTAPESSRDHSKTEAQRKHDERRWQRLEEKLKREGVHSHKERVEQLNKYLSKMSEHHDMPRIGPG